MNPPSGTVTFLFTDIESSTRLAQEFPDKIRNSLDRHNSILNEAITSNKGFVFKTVGDAFCCAFNNPGDAVLAARDAQRKLANENWNEAGIKVRMGIHSGQAEWNGEDYMGYITLARSARIMSASYGGQILFSEDSYDTLITYSEKEFSFLDLGIRRLKDLINPVRLYQVISDGIKHDFPPLKTLDARPNNLPMQLSNFIGRENEIRDLRKFLRESRLISLTGPGGTGKTRLSIQVSAELIDYFTDGVWLIELAHLNNPDFIVNNIFSVLGIKEDPGEDPVSAITKHLKDKELLLILDNCEHLINESSVLAEKIIENCRNVRIIVTSREALKCRGEVIYKVNSLETPDINQDYTLVRLSQFEAVRLFIERALGMNSLFRVTNENAPYIAEICFRLDGIPLAIELAAVRIKVLSPEKICERLNDRFKLLTGGHRTALPRQKTLKALIDWSYDLLTEKEKLLLQRLSVFSGGWTLEAAEEICADEIIEHSELLDIHSNLLDKSLINSNESEGKIRFRMQETIREYADEKLTDKSNFNKNHLSYFKKYAGKLLGHNKEISDIEISELIVQELSNIRSAISYSTEAAPHEAAELIEEMEHFWNIKGMYSEGISTVEKLLGKNSELSEPVTAKLTASLVHFKINKGNFFNAEKLINECLPVFRKMNIRKEIAKSLSILGVIATKDPEREAEAKKYYEEALMIYREISSEENVAVTLYNLSDIVGREGDKALELNYKTEALDYFRRMNRSHDIAILLASLSKYHLNLNDFDKAYTSINESLELSEKLKDNFLLSVNYIMLSNIYSKQKKHDMAIESLEKSLVLIRSEGYDANLIAVYTFLGDEYLYKGDYSLAISNFRDSIKAGFDSSNNYFLSKNIYGTGISLYNFNRNEDAVRYLTYLKTTAVSDADPISKSSLANADEIRKKLKDILGTEKYDSLVIDSAKAGKEEIVNIILEEKTDEDQVS